jgi:hypothetical protein
MNVKRIISFLKLREQLSEDELTMAWALAGTTESERELLVEMLQPATVKKPVTQQRKIEHCDACNYTKRAAVHKDATLRDYHQFRSSKPKSARVSGIATAIKDSLKRGQAADSISDGERCTYERDGGRQCWLLSDHNVHHLESVFGYHEFVAGKSAALSAESPSAPAGSETDSAAAGAVQSAVGG